MELTGAARRAWLTVTPAVELARAARRTWQRIAEPRVLRVVFLLGYVITFSIGVATLVNAPRTIEGVLGPILSVSWAFFWLLGGAVGAATVLPGWWQVERYAVAATMFGFGIYGLVVGVLHFTSEGNRLPQLGALAIALLFWVLRLVLIRGHDFEPRG